MSLVTIAEVKTHLILEVSTFDTLLNALILQISKAVNTFCDRTLEEASYKQLYNGSGDFDLMLDVYPVTAVSKLSQSLDHTAKTYDDLLAATTYLIHQKSGLIELIDNNFTKGQKNVYIEYTGGYAAAAIPQDIKLVCLDWIYKKFQDVNNQRIGLAVKNVMSENVSYIMNDINQEGKRILRKYRKADRLSGGVDVTGWAAAS